MAKKQGIMPMRAGRGLSLAVAGGAVCLILAAIGIANMWVAIAADVGVMILAVLNAIRCLFVKNL